MAGFALVAEASLVPLGLVILAVTAVAFLRSFLEALVYVALVTSDIGMLAANQ